MKTPGELFLEEMKVKLANMSDEEFNERFNSVCGDTLPIVKIHCESWLFDGSRLAIYVNIEVKNFKEYFEIGGIPIVGNGKYDLYFLYMNQGKSPLTVLTSAAEQVGFEIEDIGKLKEEIFCFVEYKDGKKNYHTICSSLEDIMAIAKCIAKSTCIPVIGYEVHNVGINDGNVYDKVVDVNAV